MTGEQRKFLKQRLEKIAGQKRGDAYRSEDVKEPAEVKRAQKLIADFDERRRDASSKRVAAIDTAVGELRRAILFDADAKAVLAALDKFERTKF